MICYPLKQCVCFVCLVNEILLFAVKHKDLTVLANANLVTYSISLNVT